MCKQNSDKCSGCGQTFESYGMDKSEAVKIDGMHFCNQDCELESSAKDSDNQEWHELGLEF